MKTMVPNRPDGWGGINVSALKTNTTELQNILDAVNALPDVGFAGGDYETWTITLTDGTVVEKEVAVL